MTSPLYIRHTFYLYEVRVKNNTLSVVKYEELNKEGVNVLWSDLEDEVKTKIIQKMEDE